MESDKIEVKENVHELFSSTGVGKFLVLQLPNKLPLVTCSEAENVTHSLRGKHDACANRTGKHLDQIYSSFASGRTYRKCKEMIFRTSRESNKLSVFALASKHKPAVNRNFAFLKI